MNRQETNAPVLSETVAKPTASIEELATVLGGPRVSLPMDEVHARLGAPLTLMQARIDAAATSARGTALPQTSLRDRVHDSLLSAFNAYDFKMLVRSSLPAEAIAGITWDRAASMVVNDVLNVLARTPALIEKFADAVHAARPGRADVRAVVREFREQGLPAPVETTTVTTTAPADPAFTARLQQALVSAFNTDDLRMMLGALPGALQHQVSWNQPGRKVVDDILRVLREHTDVVAPFADAVIARRPGRPDVQAVASELKTRGTP